MLISIYCFEFWDGFVTLNFFCYLYFRRFLKAVGIAQAVNAVVAGMWPLGKRLQVHWSLSNASSVNIDVTILFIIFLLHILFCTHYFECKFILKVNFAKFT